MTYSYMQPDSDFCKYHLAIQESHVKEILKQGHQFIIPAKTIDTVWLIHPEIRRDDQGNPTSINITLTSYGSTGVEPPNVIDIHYNPIMGAFSKRGAVPCSLGPINEVLYKYLCNAYSLIGMFNPEETDIVDGLLTEECVNRSDHEGLVDFYTAIRDTIIAVRKTALSRNL